LSDTTPAALKHIHLTAADEHHPVADREGAHDRVDGERHGHADQDGAAIVSHNGWHRRLARASALPPTEDVNVHLVIDVRSTMYRRRSTMYRRRDNTIVLDVIISPAE
jgi:hypothetical protein